MRLHDPQTEEKVLHLASRACARSGFEKPDTRWWTGLGTKLLTVFLFVTFTPAVLRSFEDGPNSQVIRLMLCAVLMMFLARSGSMLLAVSAKNCGLFSTMVNLPVRSGKALSFVRVPVLQEIAPTHRRLLGSYRSLSARSPGSGSHGGRRLAAWRRHLLHRDPA